MRLTGALGWVFSTKTVAAWGLLAVTSGLGWCPSFANAQTRKPIEMLPSPLPENAMHAPGTIYGTSPHGPLQPTDVRQSPIWSDYQQDHSHSHTSVAGGCGCSPCQCSSEKKASKNLGKKLLGKLTRGLDIMIFGSSADSDRCGCDSVCDSGCDSGCPSHDTACDAIGPSHVYGHQHLTVSPNVHPQVPQATEWMKPKYGAEPQMAPARPQQRAPQNQKLQDPFKDDPITATGRATIKPAAFRR